ncbi:Radial spoke 3 [Carpediemonas membranifera]|uniref:Radial spoke 3 n=1 Tax=Carpediemonas membranifera TaxID=201153 RepID=A0A8J6BUY9_9EUKA|nr:Radial spoke 3 [Carpediemonas membranifera]|eukprot:KAG9390861.1 Radial spoke 3 [Carpediemonas membranifera]
MSYSYKPQTRPAEQQMSSYRAEKPQGSLLHDRRVVRGSTWAARNLVNRQRAEAEQEGTQSAGSAKMRTRQIRSSARKEETEMPPVSGREHIDVQTAQYLEEITERVIEEDKSIGTDAFIDIVPLPKYIPPKVGEDVATQIEEGELFDFDVEVEAILEVLVGKTLHQALMEVQEEDEMVALRRRQEEAAARRAADLAEVHRLEEEEKRRQEEKQRRKVQEMVRLQAERVVARKVECAQVSKSYVDGIFDSVMGALEAENHFYDPVERAVETQVLPWLMAEAAKTLEEKRDLDAEVDKLIAAAFA